MPKKKEQPSAPLDVDQIEQKLAQIEADREKLQAALQQRRQTDLVEFAETIRGRITERGYRVDDVIALLQKRRRGPSRRRAQGQPYFVDPDNAAHTYSKGPLPSWLREKMHAAGYDATDKAQREAFKSNFLKQVA
jgi:DNA-binding protein H-NS